MDTQAKRGRKSTREVKVAKALQSEYSETHVHVKARQGGFNPQTGEPLNKETKLVFDTLTWKHFQEHGPAQGWRVIEVLSAPKGTNTDYNNPGK